MFSRRDLWQYAFDMILRFVQIGQTSGQMDSQIGQIEKILIFNGSKIGWMIEKVKIDTKFFSVPSI